MAGSATNYLENKLADHALGTTSYTHPSQLYVSLHTSACSDSAAGTEVTLGGYTRQSVNFGASSGGVATNSGLVTWTASGGNYGTVTHISLYDASTSGNYMWWADLNSSRVINDGDTLEIEIGNLTVTVT